MASHLSSTIRAVFLSTTIFLATTMSHAITISFISLFGTLALTTTASAQCIIEDHCETRNRSYLMFREEFRERQKVFYQLTRKDLIPGFDHTALSLDNDVYEMHPGYDAGLYTDIDNGQFRTVEHINGIQRVHSVGTWRHDSLRGQQGPYPEVSTIEINYDLGVKMVEQIELKRTSSNSTFLFLPFNFSFLNVLSPEQQKGGKGQFTCVGLIEWAAETVHLNYDQGFILNDWEYINIAIPNLLGGTLKVIKIPLLTPQLLYDTVNEWAELPTPESALAKDISWFRGAYDPVDFMITDPLGRRLGHTPELGVLNEIPGSHYKGPGDFEEFFIHAPIPGQYNLEFVGQGGEMNSAVGTKTNSFAIEGNLAKGKVINSVIEVPIEKGSPGDVNLDKLINSDDAVALSLRMGTFASEIYDPADLDRDFQITSTDADMLNKLLSNNHGRAASVCNNRNLAQSSVYQKASKTFASSISKALNLVKKKGGKPSLFSTTAKSNVDIQLAAVNESCTKIPAKILDCGTYLPKNCYQYALEPAAISCQQSLIALSKLNGSALKEVKRKGIVGSNVNILNRKAAELKAKLRTTSKSTALNPATICQ